MLELVDNKRGPALLKVIGIGGGGSNAVNRMIQAGLRGVDFWISNTDLQALERAGSANRLQLGATVTRGLGAGGDPEIGRLSAEEDLDSIRDVINGADMLFLTAGMGGGTGTGASPVIAQVAREMGVLTVAIVTKPFAFEGKKKMARALEGLDALSEHVDTLIAIPNQKLLHIVEPDTSFDDALLMADEVLFQATRGISDLITGHGIINLDFADVRSVMRERGNALLGSGAASGPDRAVEAAQAAVSSPLLEEVSIEGAEALLINIQGGTSMGFHEAAEAAQFIADRVGEEADVFWGAVVDPELDDEIRVTLVATGFPQPGTYRRVEAGTPAAASARETAPAGARPIAVATPDSERPAAVERDRADGDGDPPAPDAPSRERSAREAHARRSMPAAVPGAAAPVAGPAPEARGRDADRRDLPVDGPEERRPGGNGSGASEPALSMEEDANPAEIPVAQPATSAGPTKAAVLEDAPRARIGTDGGADAGRDRVPAGASADRPLADPGGDRPLAEPATDRVSAGTLGKRRSGDPENETPYWRRGSATEDVLESGNRFPVEVGTELFLPQEQTVGGPGRWMTGERAPKGADAGIHGSLRPKRDVGWPDPGDDVRDDKRPGHRNPLDVPTFLRKRVD